MKSVISALVTVSCAFWLGGHVMLFAALGKIFTTPGFDRETQGAFASRLFPVFERMQLTFAAIALLDTAAWWLGGRVRIKMVLFTLFAIATVIAVVETTQISPKIEAMRIAGQRGTPEFDRLHKLSTNVYMSGAVVLLIAGCFLPAAIRSDVKVDSPRTSAENPPA